MALMPILEFPDPRLRERTRPVDHVDRDMRRIIEDMFETMYDAPGVGLAANQVGVLQRFTVMDCTEQHDSPIVMINPEIISGDNLCEVEEGCLSVPGHSDTVQRYDRVIVRAQDIDGKEFKLEADGLLAQCIQHEIDHLDGKLFIDYLSRLKRERIRKKLIKDQRRG